MGVQDGGSRSKKRSDEEDVSAPEDSPPAASAERTERVQRGAEDILDDIDLTLRKSLGLDEDATEEELTERAEQTVREYVQKGGQ